ncbi:MAG: hypothetical protein JJE03_07930 [Peptostreptococcaceae bacterium]|nr:hypothetical protein [Peptostreptococcaceae bacterium]
MEINTICDAFLAALNETAIMHTLSLTTKVWLDASRSFVKIKVSQNTRRTLGKRMLRM